VGRVDLFQEQRPRATECSHTRCRCRQSLAKFDMPSRWRAVGLAIVRAALIGSPSDRVLVASIVGLLLVCFGPAIFTLRNPAPIGRTISGVKRRLDRDLPAGTSVDSAVAYLNRTGVHYMITDEPRQIWGREEGVQTEWPWGHPPVTVRNEARNGSGSNYQFSQLLSPRPNQ
jgi:hypothetical protein